MIQGMTSSISSILGDAWSGLKDALGSAFDQIAACKEQILVIL